MLRVSMQAASRAATASRRAAVLASSAAAYPGRAGLLTQTAASAVVRVAQYATEAVKAKPVEAAPAVAQPSRGDLVIGDHIKIQFKQDGIFFIRIDSPGTKFNVLSRGVMSDFAKALDFIESDPSLKVGILISGKPDGFIAGADITMLASAKSAEELQQLSTEGQKLNTRLEKSRVPIIAAIHGACLGGGLEVALACSYRIATSSPTTALGLPEVSLGLLPGAGGTQRITELVGLAKALDLTLTGKKLKADQARKIKLVDVVTKPQCLEFDAIQIAKLFLSGSVKPYKREKGIVDRLLEDFSYGRDFVLNKAKENVKKLTGGKYPAPFAIIDTIATGLAKGRNAGFAKEAQKFGELGMTNESKSLVSIYFGQTALKKNRFGKPSRSYENIHVIGAGLMGAGITQVSIERGLKAVLKDQSEAGLSRGRAQILKNLNEKVQKKRLSEQERGAIVRNATFVVGDDPKGAELIKSTDVVIEAVFEDLNLKRKILHGLEKTLPPHAVISSNTSALPIKDIAEGAQRPENIIGMHYFSPVDKMPLLEIITTDKTSKETISAAVEVGLRQGKTVIVVKDGPGFYTTRILSPYTVEACALLQEGHGIKAVDSAIKEFGFPVGPITLLDEVGIDVGSHILPTLVKAFGPRMEGANSQMLAEMISKGYLGRKSQKGFFVYDKSKKDINPGIVELINKYKVAPTTLSKTDIQQRIVFRMVNEVVFCLQDGTLASTLDGDMGAVFGLGFPPFLGGPFRWIDTYGAQKMVDELHRYRDLYGERFAPAPLLVDYAKSGKKFHN